MTIDVFSAGAVQAMTAYTVSVERALQLTARADAMPIRWIFADGQRAARCAVIHQATQALNDAYDAASRVEHLDGIKFALAGKSAMVDAKLAYRSLDAVPSFVAFRTAAVVERDRIRDVTHVVAGLGPDATPGQRASMLATVRLGTGGDDAARERLRLALVAGMSTDTALRQGGSARWGAHDALAEDLARKLTSTTDEASIDAMVSAVTSTWTSQVTASVVDRIATTAEDSRILLSAVRADLEGIRTRHPAARQLIANTYELIDRNETRLATSVAEGSGLGYKDHPDYAELGRIQANLRLLRSIDAVDEVAPAAPVAPATAATSAGSGTGERLVW